MEHDSGRDRLVDFARGSARWPMRTLITNGTIVTADGSYPAYVLVDGQRIAQVGASLGGAVGADETIDATGDSSFRAGSTSNRLILQRVQRQDGCLERCWTPRVTRLILCR